MKKEITSIVKKSAKVGAAVCVGAGAVALITSATAIKAITEGAKYLKDTVKKIVDDKPNVDASAVEEDEETPVPNSVVESKVINEQESVITE